MIIDEISHILSFLCFFGISGVLVPTVYIRENSKHVLVSSSASSEDIPSFFEPPKRYIIVPDLSNVTFCSNTLLVFVQSALMNVAKRRQIRETWANTNYYSDPGQPCSKIAVFFVFGEAKINVSEEVSKDIEEEILHHSDILMLNMTDVYDNLAYKGYLAMKWITHNIPFVKYVMKTDDDVLLNTFGWFQVVDTLQKQNVTCGIVGWVWQKPPVQRIGKYMATKAEYNKKYYPSFCSGAGYVMTANAMFSITQAAEYVPYFKRDDPLFAGVLAKALGISLISLPKESYLLNKREWTNQQKTKSAMVIHAPPRNIWMRTWQRYFSRPTKLTSASNKQTSHVLLNVTDTKTRLPEVYQLSELVSNTLRCANHNVTRKSWTINL